MVSRTSNSDVLTVTVPVELANKILDASYNVYEHSSTGHTIHRTESYSLPLELKGHVSLVGPTTRFPHPSSSLSILSDPSAEDAASLNSPSVLRKLYGVNSAVGGSSPSNKQAVTAFLGQYYSATDLAQFFKTLLPLGANTPITLVGDATTGKAGVESMLDIEYMPAMGALNPTGFWGFSGSSPIDAADEPFLTWLYTVGNTTDVDVPKVFSTSYGEEETAEVPTDYSDRINAEFMKAGLRGISLLFASGDSGAVTMSHTCPGGRFSPKWPAGSPYVTAVGGTEGGASLPETAWSGSSGGFSDAFPVPSWQANATASYIALSASNADMPPASYYNAGGRGFPDIAAAAINFPVIVGGRQQSVAGTSCASPTAGGIVGLLNDKRLEAGKSSLGFLNQILYMNPNAMNDVVSGTSEGCVLGQKGYPAKSGWDAVTGLGSMDYGRMLEVSLALP